MIPFSDADVQHRSIPKVNILLISINALVFLYELQIGGFSLLGGGGNRDISIFFLRWGFIPEAVVGGEPFTSLRVAFLASVDSRPLGPAEATVFSSMFIHGGFMHFAGNMMFLWVFGDNIEDNLGHLKYLGFYLLAGVVAALAQLGIDLHSEVPMVGASGAISGVLGAYLLQYPYNRVKVLVVFYFITVVELRAMWLLGLWFGWQLIQGLGSLGISDQISVAFFAHVGGFVAGIVLMGAYKLATRQSLIPAHRGDAGEYRYRPR